MLPDFAVQISTPTSLEIRVYSERMSDLLKRYERTLNQFGYDYISSSINNRNFKITKLGEYGSDVVLMKFNDSYLSVQDILNSMDNFSFRPADLVELLEFGNINRAIQRHFRITALGSSWARKGSNHVKFPELCSSMSGSRHVDLSEFNSRKLKYTLFAVVKKETL